MKRVLPALIVAVGVCPALVHASPLSPHDAQLANQAQLEYLAQNPVVVPDADAPEEYSRLDATQPAQTAPAQAAQSASAKVAPGDTSVRKLVTKYAVAHGVDPALAHAIVKVESNYNCNAKNPTSSATGLMQTLVPTARGVGVTGNLRDCRTSLEAGMRYLRQAIEKHGAGCAGASAYNLGHYGSSRCTGYGRRVMGIAASIDVSSME
jgi:soluble lytic murein transglycosylase-like protein